MWSWLFWSSGIMLLGCLAHINLILLFLIRVLCLIVSPNSVLPGYQLNSFIINSREKFIFTTYKRMIPQQLTVYKLSSPSLYLLVFLSMGPTKIYTTLLHTQFLIDGDPTEGD